MHATVGRPAWLSLFATAALVCLTHTARGQASRGASGSEEPARPGIKGLDFSPNGRILAAAAGDDDEKGVLVVWEIETRKPRFVHRQPDGMASVAFSPDGTQVAVGCYDNTARIVDAETGRAMQTFAGHTDDVRSVAFTPDGRALVTASEDATIRLWNLETGATEAVLEKHDSRIYSIAVSPDGQWILSGSRDKTSRLWDRKTGKLKHTFEPSNLIVRRVAFSADGRWFLTCRYDNVVRIRETGTNRLRARIESGNQCARLAPGNELLAVCDGDSEVELFELELRDPTPQEKRRIEKLIARWHNDDIRVREAATRKLVQLGLPAEPLLFEALDADSAEVRIRARRARRRVQSPSPTATLEGQAAGVGFLSFSPDGKLLATGDHSGTVRLWNVETRETEAELTPP